MATYIYKHAVKANGKIVPAGTPVEVESAEVKAVAATDASAAPKKTKKTAEKSAK